MTRKNRQRVKYRLSRSIIYLARSSHLINAIMSDYVEHDPSYTEELNNIYGMLAEAGSRMIKFWETSFGEFPEDISSYAKVSDENQ